MEVLRRDRRGDAGLGPGDVALLYDANTIAPILFLEDVGFCRKGEGVAFVVNAGIAPGGRLPVDTDGGGLSYCHSGMYGPLDMIECVRQLRGSAAHGRCRTARSRSRTATAACCPANAPPSSGRGPRSDRRVRPFDRGGDGWLDVKVVPLGTLAKRSRAAGAGVGAFDTPTAEPSERTVAIPSRHAPLAPVWRCR